MEVKINIEDEINNLKLAKKFLKTLKKQLSKYGINQVKLVVYGSRVRGNFRWDSDLDILVLVDDRSFSREVVNIIRDIAGDISWETTIPISVMVYRESDFREERTPFLKEVKSYGRIFK